ncbi:hypothetical protein [Colwellia sp. PAMC 21821]|uniref:hypothetical protein n=1 Tax=Colwellia sp. PAMC 21821 TaxID=1816219 RepID=UPI0009C10406|nr:hypothetical protein [Colwellia sp. PAMC 21821]ARD45294.1 hypothetical protein A3Q33_13915 [Colwellia sp. PAMC 21821]
MVVSKILKLENRQLNFWALMAFFVIGVLIELGLGVHSFIYLCLLASFAFTEKPEQHYFQDPKDLGEYSSEYLPSIYRAFMAISFVVLAYSHSALITLDIAFFILWSLGYSLLGFTSTFIPKNGLKVGGNYKITQVYFIIFLSINLVLIYWLITAFSGFNWFSSVITKLLSLVVSGL